MARQQVTVPDIGGAENAEVIEVLVAVGDEVARDQGLIVLESDKASMEIPSTAAGRVVELLVAEGAQLSEGAAVAVIEVTDGAGEEVAGEAAPAAVAAEEAPPSPAAPDSPATATIAAQEKVAAVPAAAVEQTVPVPDIGTDEPVEVIEVCVAVGDSIAEGDSMVVLESDKASMEVPSPAAGEVVALRVAAGDAVRQGDPLLVLRGPAPAAETTAAPEAPPAQPKAPNAPPRTGAADAVPPAGQAAAPPEPATGVYAGPSVRKLARELGVDLQRVKGSGPRSRILKEDLQQYVQRSLRGQPEAVAGGAIPAIPEVDFARFGEVEVTERSKVDKLTAANMQRSWLNVPHVTQFDEADISELETFRAGLKAEAARRGIKLSPLPFILKACAVALRDNPKFNSSLAAGGEQLVFKRYCHIGMAVDTPAGLVVPVIRDVDRKSLWELAAEVQALAAKARERKLTPAEMQGGCFTVSSLGNIGGAGFTPIINPPEVGILGVSRAASRPVWDGSAFAPRTLLPLALSYDHRVINGGDAGRFLTQLVGLLEELRRLLL